MSSVKTQSLNEVTVRGAIPAIRGFYQTELAIILPKKQYAVPRIAAHLLLSLIGGLRRSLRVESTSGHSRHIYFLQDTHKLPISGNNRTGAVHQTFVSINGTRGELYRLRIR